MLKRSLFIPFILCLSLLAACGFQSEDSELSHENSDSAVENFNSSDSQSEFGAELYNDDSDEQSGSFEQKETTSDKKKINDQMDRKVIYTADLQIEVKNYENTFNSIQTQVTELNGYIVETNMYEDQESGSKSGHITTRVPQDKFQEFITLVEEGSSKVLESSSSGQDVTEEYVDLESRIKSKRVVEERLLSFMEEAKKTEDLLKISNDLADVQEEIEGITGRMKYLQNKSDLATVSIYMQEKNVSLSNTGKDDLNTWEQTKEQFMKSINLLINAMSAFFVFIIGNLPIFILIGIVILVVVFLVKRRSKNKKGLD